jgi:hypothetical protein
MVQGTIVAAASGATAAAFLNHALCSEYAEAAAGGTRGSVVNDPGKERKSHDDR